MKYVTLNVVLTRVTLTSICASGPTFAQGGGNENGGSGGGNAHGLALHVARRGHEPGKQRPVRRSHFLTRWVSPVCQPGTVRLTGTPSAFHFQTRCRPCDDDTIAPCGSARRAWSGPRLMVRMPASPDQPSRRWPSALHSGYFAGNLSGRHPADTHFARVLSVRHFS
jgi:hypothetical protein